MQRIAVFIALAVSTASVSVHAQQSSGSGTQQTEASSGDTSAETARVDEAAVRSTPIATTNAEEQARGVTPTPPPEDLDARTTPIVEIHGYLRTRFELFHNFSLGWDVITPQGGMPTLVSQSRYNSANLPWFRNPDNAAQFCDPLPPMGALTARPGSCSNATQWSANMRLRLNPEIHPTEWITVHSQIDILDNLVLGSTPDGYYTPSRSLWVPINAFTQTQIPPVFGYNALIDSVMVKRAWAEVTNQSLGQIRFGRMPSHWGLGILANAGNGLDSDYQTTADRLMYAARIRPLGIFFAAIWDFPSSGATSQNLVLFGDPGQGQPYDLGTFDNVYQWIAAVGRRMEPEQQRAALARGELVLNGGGYFVYRTQFLSGEGRNTITMPLGSIGDSSYGQGLARRGGWAFISDLWGQLLGRDFRLEAEAVYIRGGIESVDLSGAPRDDFIISQFGAAVEGEYRLMNNRLKLELRGGYATGDPDMEGLNFFNGLRAQARNDRFLTLFRFHPDYRIDLIFWRQIMRQFAGAYYLRPSVQYNFIADPGGDLVFARADVIWSRASEFISTRGNHADLGVEIDATLQYQSNHRRDPNDMRPVPGFYAMAQYGIFFPLGGLGLTDDERNSPPADLQGFQLQTAQTARAVLGVTF